MPPDREVPNTPSSVMSPSDAEMKSNQTGLVQSHKENTDVKGGEAILRTRTYWLIAVVVTIAIVLVIVFLVVLKRKSGH
ncbi:hypothetical protein BDN72DRAFT_845389 [Pluteus cervinus]|uniref:Uncharacterized protein n=1 Tax=Pluteus cervinus TaxID=181527 RepID=A0ACD3AJ87_9AGAR|nr:hypothetical protein BDN72DRAFT_845389 [Pluteus cervinus]